MKYLYIISKQEFTSLYRYGQIPLHSNQIIETLSKSTHEIESHVLENLKTFAYFVGDEEYLLISFSEFNNDNNLISIENVTEIIPMTKASKSSLAMKFDNRLDFSEPRFENVFHKMEEYIDIEERFNGAKAFCKLSKLNNPFHKLVDDEVIVNSYYLKLNDGNLSNERTYYTQLLAYERYEFFPNTDLGYFYDAGEVFAHFKGLPTFVGSNFYNYLQSIKEEYSNKSFIEITDAICNADEIKKFTDSLTSNDIREFIVAAIFQKFKSDLRERDTIIRSETGKTIKYINDNKQYINELSIAIYLTGAFFGYKKFYDDLYAIIDLNIFKKVNVKNSNSKKIITAPQTQKISSEILSGEENINFENTINSQVVSHTVLADTILDKIKILINHSSNGEIKLSGKILEEMKNILKPIFKSKKTTVNGILDFIQKEYSKELDIPKDKILTIKQDQELF